MLRNFRNKRAARHTQIASDHQENLADAYTLYRSLGDTHTEAKLRLDGLSSTDYHRAQIRLHLALADRWRPTDQ